MTVDFTKISTFKMNFDQCDTYHKMGVIISEIEASDKPRFLAVLEAADKYYNELRLAAVYTDGSMEICDKDDLKVLIENFPEEWK